MFIKTDVEALLRRLFATLPLKSDVERAPPPSASLPPGFATRLAWVDPAQDCSNEAEIGPLLEDLRSWSVAMAWSSRPSRAVLEYVLLAVEGRLDETEGDALSPVRRQAILATCRDEAWRIIMDIRRAA